MDDSISRQAVLNTLDNMDKALDEDRTVEKYKELLTECIKVLPSAEKKGEWQHDGSHWKNRFICSVCGYKLFDAPTNYCPNCGADMRRGE